MDMFALIVTIAASIVYVYGQCTYPPQFPGAANYQTIELGIQAGFVEFAGTETPITARTVNGIGTFQWDCMATYDAQTLAVRTQQRPILADNIPAAERTSDNSIACYLYATQVLIRDVTGSYGEGLGSLMEFGWGLLSIAQIQAIQNQVENCTINNATCLDAVADSYGYCGDVMGIIVGLTLVETLNNDGWNAKGELTPFGDCTANCRPFSDPIGLYDPRVAFTDIELPKEDLVGRYWSNSPIWGLRTFFGFTPQDSWKELLEDDGRGYFFRQEHVTPHIGFSVDPITFSFEDLQDSQDLIDDPDYDYHDEAELLLERLRNTATNDSRKAIIETLDDKIAAAAIIQINHWSVFNPSYEENVIFETGQRLAEYQAVLLAWRQKIRYNLIRPTTIIQSGDYTDDIIETYGGPFQGVKNISARDFQPYIRTMPHAEYPSGSGCICRVWLDHVDKFVLNQYGAPSLPIFFLFFPTTGPGGVSNIEPGGSFESYTAFWPDMNTFYQNCANSRLWGGMHFTDSIEASDELCSDGVGEGIYDYLQALLPPARRRMADRQEKIEQGTNRRRLSAAEDHFNDCMDELSGNYALYGSNSNC